jgi:TetR/AcrR family transcriptional repressor of mexJK operon
LGATHRELIIQAAQKRFHQYGYSKVTMEEIAADIQTSKSALYYHFADKNAIFREVLSLEQRAFQDQTQQLISNERCGSKRLKGYFAIILQMLCRFQNLGVFDPSAWIVCRFY